MSYEFYESLIAEMYDGDYAVARTPSGDVDFYVERAVDSGGPVVEWGCGTGRVLVPTAEAGVEIVGVDPSPSMLGRTAAKLEGRSLPAQLVEGDMRTVALKRQFVLATAPFRMIGHLETIDDQVAAFENVRRHLVPGGRFIVDFFNPKLEMLLEPFGPALSIEREEDGRKIRRYHSVQPDVTSQINKVTFEWEIEDADGAVERHKSEFTMRWYTRYEVEHLLVRTGFEIESLAGDFRGRPFESGCPEVIFTARNP